MHVIWSTELQSQIRGPLSSLASIYGVLETAFDSGAVGLGPQSAIAKDFPKLSTSDSEPLLRYSSKSYVFESYSGLLASCRAAVFKDVRFA